MNYKRFNNKLVEVKVRDINTNLTFSSGYLKEESSSLICILRIYDFFVDGYDVLKKDRLLSVQNREIDRYHDKIIKTEKITKMSQSLPSLDISTEDSFLEEIISHHYPLAARWFSKDKKDCLTLGFLTDIKAQTFSMRSISTGGVLSRRNVVLRKEDVFGYLYGDRYTTLYGKYAKEAQKK